MFMFVDVDMVDFMNLQWQILYVMVLVGCSKVELGCDVFV